MREAVALWLLTCVLTVTLAQDNASPKIPDHLMECYKNQSIFHRENRLPARLSTFVDLIRKVERSPSGSNMNAREIAASLQYFLRMDGILPSLVTTRPEESILPFAAMGDEFFRHRLNLVRLLNKPSQLSYLFLTESLTKKEMCNLHFMLSYSTDTTKRLDEQCGNIVQEAYNIPRRRVLRQATLRALRDKRADSSEESKEAEDKNTQVETLPTNVVALESPLSNSSETDRNSDFTVGKNVLLTSPAMEGPLRGGILRDVQKKSVRLPTLDRYIPNVERSSCPVENGVVLTPFGSVTIGTVIAGIIAGLQRQNIAPKDLGVTANELKPELATLRIDNVWAVTLAGDLSDLILAVGNIGDGINSAIGLRGGWNNSIQPKWYLLSSDSPAYVTDAELRGALDGLWLGKNVDTWTRSASNLKLSHILDMYYSQQGVFGTGVQACNRRSSFPAYAPDVEFNQQLELFSVVMQKQRVNSATITDFTSLVSNVISNVKSYVPSFDSGSICDTNNANQASSPADYFLNLVVVVDNSWTSGALNDILSILLDKEVVAAPFMSNTTIICGMDGRQLYQGSDAVSFNGNFTTSTLNTCASGMDFVQSLYSIEVIFRQMYDKEKQSGRVNRGAYAVLFLPYSQSTAPINTGVWSKKQTFNTSLPDVTFLVATNGPKDSFNVLVDNSNTDSFTLRAPSASDPSSIEQVKAIATRLQTIPQRLAKPQCGSYYDTDDTNKGILTDNVRVGYTKFYRLQPNYFYKTHGTPKISVKSTRSTVLTVCVSRSDPTPTGTVTGSGGGVGNNPNYQPRQYPSNPQYPQNPTYPTNPQYPRNPQNPQGYGGWNQQYPQVQWREQGNTWSSSKSYPYGRLTLATDAKCVNVNQAATDLQIEEDPCSDYSYIFQCPPVYVSVSAPLTSDIPTSQCVQDCRLPTNAEYEVILENLSCANGAGELLVSPITVLLTTLLLFTTTRTLI